MPALGDMLQNPALTWKQLCLYCFGDKASNNTSGEQYDLIAVWENVSTF